MRTVTRRPIKRNPIPSHTPRIGILGVSSHSAQRVWKAIHTAGLIIAAVGGNNGVEAETFIKACGGTVLTKGNIGTGLHHQQQQQQQQEDSVKVRACTYEELIDGREVDIVYITIPVIGRDVWVKRCIRQRKHVLLSIPAAPAVDVLQKWIELANAQRLLITDDAALMQGQRLDRVCAMLSNSGDKTVGPLRSLRVCCCCSSASLIPCNNNNNNNNNNNTHGNIGSFSTTCVADGGSDNSTSFGVFADLGWMAVAALLYVVHCEVPTTVLGRALQYGKTSNSNSNNKNIIEFAGELTFTDGDIPVTASIYLNCVPSTTTTTTTTTNSNNNNNNNNNNNTMMEQSLMAYGTTGSLTIHDLIVPASHTDDNTTTITLAVNEGVQGKQLRRNVRREEEVRVVEGAIWGELPWRRLRDALSWNTQSTSTSVASHFRGDTEEALKYMKHTWATQVVVDALLNAAKMSAELEAGIKG